MNIAEQVCSIDLAKRLKELGIHQDSVFNWFHCSDDTYELDFNNYSYVDLLRDEYISAFNVSELLNIIPNRITLKEGEPFNSFRFSMEKSFIIDGMDNPETLKKTDTYIVNYYCDTCHATGDKAFMSRPLMPNVWDANPANALAKMLIDLVGNKLIEIST